MRIASNPLKDVSPVPIVVLGFVYLDRLLGSLEQLTHFSSVSGIVNQVQSMFSENSSEIRTGVSCHEQVPEPRQYAPKFCS